MLIINILLIFIFLIILFNDTTIIEGQNSNYGHLMDYTINDLYNTVVDNILNIKLNEKEINKYIFENYKITCKNSENAILNEDNFDLNEYIKQVSKNNDDSENENINNDDSENKNINENINNLFNYLNIKFTDNNNTSLKKDEKNIDNQIHLCDLVPMIYDENSSASLVSKITSNYGNCYDIEEPGSKLSTINELCKRDCSLIDYKINDCDIFQPVNIKNCNEYKGDKDKIFLKKENGVYYNCEKNNEGDYKQKICRPGEDIICNAEKTDLFDTCKGIEENPEIYSSSSYKLDNNIITKSINCQKKNDKGVDIIDNNILHCQNVNGFQIYNGVCY